MKYLFRFEIHNAVAVCMCRRSASVCVTNRPASTLLISFYQTNVESLLRLNDVNDVTVVLDVALKANRYTDPKNNA